MRDEYTVTGIPPGLNSTILDGPVVHLTSRDIWTSFASGAANTFAQMVVSGAYYVLYGASLGGIGKLSDGPPKVELFTPKSTYFARQGGAVAEGLSVLAGGRSVGSASSSGPRVGGGAGAQVIAPRNLPTTGGVALGRDIGGGGVKALAEQTGSSYFRNWAREGITRRTIQRHFGRAFHQAVARAPVIRFTLDGIDDVAGAVRSGRAGFTPGNFTNAELHYIATNPEILAKTIFYRGGQIVESPF